MTVSRRWLSLALAGLMPLLLASLCGTPFQWARDLAVAELRVTIHYDDDFYRETFNYAPDAPNIRHFVLVLPKGVETDADPDWIFTSLDLTGPDLRVREDRQEYAWALDYIYPAPNARFEAAFEPGTYRVAAAFLAGPVSREDLGLDDDVILWPGVTGGGANTDFVTVELNPGETDEVAFEMTDADGWACPWLYVFDGVSFVRRTEILRNLNSPASEATETTSLGPVAVVDGAIYVRVSEERDEVTYLDALLLVVAGETIAPAPNAEAAWLLAAADGHRLVLARGEARELRFPVPASYAPGDSVTVVARGYYVPVAGE